LTTVSVMNETVLAVSTLTPDPGICATPANRLGNESWMCTRGNCAIGGSASSLYRPAVLVPRSDDAIRGSLDRLVGVRLGLGLEGMRIMGGTCTIVTPLPHLTPLLVQTDWTESVSGIENGNSARGKERGIEKESAGSGCKLLPVLRPCSLLP
jgi:hypothetical protein